MVEIQSVPAKRPPAVTIACLFVFAACLFVAVFTPLEWTVLSKQFGATLLYEGMAGMAISFAAFVGYWQMRKWGFYLYVAFTAVNFLLSIGLPVANYSFFTIPLILILIGYTHLDKMK